MTWKRLDVKPDAAAAFKAAFAQAFARARHPCNAALFEVTVDDGVHLYLSPGAAALFEITLKTAATKSTGAPPPNAALVTGDAGTWGRTETWGRK